MRLSNIMRLARRPAWFLVGLASATLLACKGDTGPTGPAGATGPAGPNGPNGPPGTANVKYSPWISPASWTLEASFGVQQRYYVISAPSLTQAIVDSGVILVYVKFVGFSPQIQQLPLTVPDQGLTYWFWAQASQIKLVYWHTADHTIDPGTIPATNLFRYVLVPGGTPAAALVSYAALQKYFSIPD